MKVLIVDGSIEIIERMKDYISAEHSLVDCFHASSGNQALKMIDELQPSVVIVDINLLEKQSFRLIKYLKEKHVNTFIIGLSGQPEENLKKRSRSIGVDVFLDKYHEFEKVPGIIKDIYLTWNLTTK